MKKFIFDVPCYYVYEVEAETEKEAREILIKDGGLDLIGDLSLDESDYKKARILRSWGRLSSVLADSENINKRLNIKIGGYEYDRKFIFEDLGFNIEPSELSASFGLVQLKKFSKFEKLRKLNFNYHFNFYLNFVLASILNIYYI